MVVDEAVVDLIREVALMIVHQAVVEDLVETLAAMNPHSLQCLLKNVAWLLVEVRYFRCMS